MGYLKSALSIKEQHGIPATWTYRKRYENKCTKENAAKMLISLEFICKRKNSFPRKRHGAWKIKNAYCQGYSG